MHTKTKHWAKIALCNLKQKRISQVGLINCIWPTFFLQELYVLSAKNIVCLPMNIYQDILNFPNSNGWLQAGNPVSQLSMSH